VAGPVTVIERVVLAKLATTHSFAKLFASIDDGEHATPRAPRFSKIARRAAMRIGTRDRITSDASGTAPHDCVHNDKGTRCDVCQGIFGRDRASYKCADGCLYDICYRCVDGLPEQTHRKAPRAQSEDDESPAPRARPSPRSKSPRRTSFARSPPATDDDTQALLDYLQEEGISAKAALRRLKKSKPPASPGGARRF
jgi:hypothetical protein